MWRPCPVYREAVPDEGTGEWQMPVAWWPIHGAEDGGGEGEGAAKPATVQNVKLAPTITG